MGTMTLDSNRSIISNLIKFSTIKGLKSFNHGKESINRDIWMGL